MKGKKIYGAPTRYSEEYYRWKKAAMGGNDATHEDEVWKRKHQR